MVNKAQIQQQLENSRASYPPNINTMGNIIIFQTNPQKKVKEFSLCDFSVFSK